LVYKIFDVMKEVVKRLCKEQGTNLKELSGKMGIARESLTRALSGNPTLATIDGIARALNVSVWELFAGSGNSFNGFVEFNGKIYRIRSRFDLENILKLSTPM